MDPQKQFPPQQPEQPSQPWGQPPVQPTVQQPENPSFGTPTTPQAEPYGRSTSFQPQNQPTEAQPAAQPYNPYATVPMASSTHPRKAKMFIGIGLALVILLAAGAVFALTSKKDSDGGYKSQSGSSSESSDSSESFDTPATKNTAVYTDDYKVVCQGSTISNAADYDASSPGPHPMTVFEKGSATSDNKKYSSSSVYLGGGADADYKEPEKVQLVACLARDGDGEFVKDCQLKDNDDKIIPIKLRQANYKLDIYAAKTGKKIGHSVITETSDSCPYIALVDSSDPTYYALPDSQAVKIAVQTYTQ